ncbi:GNAT family N-acetyltransferase [Streptomyces sp. WAC05292]|nr:GNAT family N-acetyltransferase [Streptomyces sp. WAC05292]
MTVVIRDLRPLDPADAEAVVRVRRAALPFMVSTPAGVAFELASAPAARHARILVAEDGAGLVVGTAQIGIAHDGAEPGRAFVNAQVDPAHRRRGAGTALLRAAEEHLAACGAVEVYAWVLDEGPARAFAERHGYRSSRSAHFLRLDLSAAVLPPAPAELPAGVELRPGSAFADDPRPLFEADAAASADEPGDVPLLLDDYEEWLRTIWSDPELDKELTSVAVVDGTVAAFTAARTDGAARYGSAMTGTVRAFRGRGLAKLAKADSLRRARAAGYREAFTGNDTGNGPMLAINEWFGYEVCATEVRYVKPLPGPAEGDGDGAGDDVAVALSKAGRTKIRYPARVLSDDGDRITVRARWAAGGVRDFGFVRFEPGDVFTEHYWRSRWYAVKEVRTGGGALKGWYCDITRPAAVAGGEIRVEDLDLDLWVSADASAVLRLDEDEFAASGLAVRDPEAAAEAVRALDALDRQARTAEGLRALLR